MLEEEVVEGRDGGSVEVELEIGGFVLMDVLVGTGRSFEAERSKYK